MKTIQTLLTDHLDIWTAADTEKKSGRGRSSGNADRVYGIRKLRELILELAVRGKLVPQNANDEPASDLLKRIQAEKARLIAEGKIKKDKPLSQITKDEKPYELPHGWEWVRLGQVVEVLDGFRKPVTKQDREPGPYPYYGASGIVDYVSNFIFDEPLVLVGEDGAKWGRGDTTAFLISGKTWVNNHAHVIRPYRLALIDDFVALSLNAMDLGAFITGMTVPKLNQARLVSIVLPLPSVAEQHRIVAKVDELMALCDRLEQQQTHSTAAHQALVEILLGTLTRVASPQEFSAAWARIASHFDTLFITEASIDQLKQTILQLAVMGKLVPQEPNDEPASVLINNVTELRKLKSFAAISEAEALFEVSNSWRWVRFGDFLEVTSSKRIHVSDYTTEGVPFFRSKEIGELKRGQSISTDIFISIEKFESLKNLSGFPCAGDLMLTSVGSIGNTWICDGRDFYYKDGNITKIGSHKFTDMRYVQCFIESPVFSNQVTDTVSGTAYNALTIIKLNNLHFPLPPLAEQHRIVAKVGELMSLCDTLKARLADAQAIQLHLADTIVEQAVC